MPNSFEGFCYPVRLISGYLLLAGSGCGLHMSFSIQYRISAAHGYSPDSALRKPAKHHKDEGKSD